MPAALGRLLDQERPDLGGQRGELGRRHRPQVGRRGDPAERGRRALRASQTPPAVVRSDPRVDARVPRRGVGRRTTHGVHTGGTARSHRPTLPPSAAASRHRQSDASGQTRLDCPTWLMSASVMRTPDGATGTGSGQLMTHGRARRTRRSLRRPGPARHRHRASRGVGARAGEHTSGLRGGLGGRRAWVEADTQPTADGVPVILHDDDLDRTTTGRARCGGTPAAELGRLRDPSGCRAPGCRSWRRCSTCCRPDAGRAAGDQGRAHRRQVAEILRLCAASGHDERVFLQSFEVPVLEQLRALAPARPVGCWSSGWTPIRSAAAGTSAPSPTTRSTARCCGNPGIVPEPCGRPGSPSRSGPPTTRRLGDADRRRGGRDHHQHPGRTARLAVPAAQAHPRELINPFRTLQEPASAPRRSIDTSGQARTIPLPPKLKLINPLPHPSGPASAPRWLINSARRRQVEQSRFRVLTS